MLRGPQGTLYGRNSMLGVMAVETLSPAVWQGVRANVEYGSANSLRVNASMYKNNLGAAVMYGHSDGFYTNEYSGSKCDVSDAVSVRLRYVKTAAMLSLTIPYMHLIRIRAAILTGSGRLMPRMRHKAENHWPEAGSIQ